MSEIEIDQLIDSTRVDGSGAEIAPPALAPLGAWSEVDPDYEEFDTDDSDPDEDEDADDLTQEELDAPEPDGDAATVIEPVGIELWGQNLDEGTEWVKVAEQDLDGDGEAGIAMIPNVPTATQMRYRLRLVYSDGSFSKWSEQQEVTTPRDLTAPPAPSSPLVLTQYGHTQGGWDGELTAESPIDFDHTRLYVQQMAPETGEEPPEGGYVAGDPQLVTRFSSEGYHMLGFLPEAEHRAFLTSVDTSGNESARSEYVYFTPTPPVDREEIEQKLQEAERERQEYRDAFDERTAEYDARLDDAADALAAADAWSASAFYRAEDAAGEAIRTRQSVDGLRPVQSLSEPSGSGDEGQLWEQFDQWGRDRKLIGAWRYTDGEWQPIDLSTTYLPMADISEATIGDLQAQRLFAETGEVQRLLVGDAENILPAEMLTEFHEQGLGSLAWRAISGGASGWGTITGRGNHPLRLRWQGSQYGSSTSRLAYSGRDGRGIPVKPGDQFRLSMAGWNGTTGLHVSARYSGEDLSFVARETVVSITNDSPSGSWVVPSDGSIRRMEIEFVGTSASAAGNADFGDIEVRRALTGELIVDGLLQADRGVIRELITETAVGQTALFELVRAGLIEADEGLIGSVLLKEGAVTADKLNVTEEMVARFAQILHLVADQVDMNTFVAQSGMVGVLEAIGIVLSDEAAGRRFSVSGQGIHLEDTETGQTIAQLGLHGDDLLSLHDPETGEPTVSMTGSGGVAAVHVDSQGDLHTGGKALAGRHYDSPRWHSSDSVIDYLPQGAHLWWRRVFEGETTTTGGAQAGITVAHLEARVIPGRLYRIKCHDFEMGDRTAYWAQAYLTTSDDPDVRPTRPTRETPSDSLWGPRVPGRVPPSGSGNNTSLNYEWLVTFPQAQRMRVIFTVGNSASTGNVFGSATRSQALLSIEDLGPSTGPKGYDMLSGSMATGETIPELPEDISQSYGISRTATYTLDLDTRIATRAYYDGTPRFGRWDDGTWYMSLVEFDSWASQPGQRTRMDYSVSVSRWLNDGRGHIFQSSVPTFSGLPASFHIDNDLLHMDDQRNVGRWTPRTVTPEEETLEAALGKSQPNLAVGRTGWGSLNEGLPASGRINLDAGMTVARLSTEMGGGSE